MRYFCVLTQTGNMRKAAELIGLSPSALSKAIRVLEGELGFELITPSGRGLLITERGQKLAQKASRLIEEFRKLAEPEDLESREHLPLRIGSFEVFTTYFLGKLIEEGFSERPVSVHELVPGHIESALVNHQIDLGITYIPVPMQDLDHLKVTEINMGIFGKWVPRLSEMKFALLPFVIPVTPIAGSPTKAQGLDGWPDDRIPRLVKYRVTLMESALELCRRGLAVAYLPSFIVELHNRNVIEGLRLKAVSLPSGMRLQKQPVYLVKRKCDVEDVSVRKVAKVLRQVANALEGNQQND